VYTLFQTLPTSERQIYTHTVLCVNAVNYNITTAIYTYICRVWICFVQDSRIRNIIYCYVLLSCSVRHSTSDDNIIFALQQCLTLRGRVCVPTRTTITIYRTGTINTVRGSCLYASVQSLCKTEHSWMGVLEKSFFHGAYTHPGRSTAKRFMFSSELKTKSLLR